MTRKESSQPTRRRLLLSGGSLAVLTTLAACDKVLPTRFNGVDITGASYATDFRLADADGRERTLADFKGKAVMMFFGFTQCPDVCPTALCARPRSGSCSAATASACR